VNDIETDSQLFSTLLDLFLEDELGTYFQKVRRMQLSELSADDIKALFHNPTAKNIDEAKDENFLCDLDVPKS